MKKVYLTFALAVAMVAIVGSGLFATTTFWFSQDAGGTPIGGNELVVPQGGTVTLYCIMSSDDVGNTFEAMVGYDTSDASTHGAGVDTNDGAAKKLTLLTSQNDIVTSIDSFFDVFTTVGYASQQVVLDASGREVANPQLVGRPYGFVVRSSTSTNGAPGQKALCSFELSNNMVAPADEQYVVVSSDLAGGNSFSSAWKHGLSLFEDAYALKIVNEGTGGPVVGANNKAILDTIMTTVAASYTWVFWGEVSNVAAGTFDIDDGSKDNVGDPVIIHVVAPGHGQSNGEYVSVKGSIDVGTRTLTSQEIVVQ